VCDMKHIVVGWVNCMAALDYQDTISVLNSPFVMMMKETPTMVLISNNPSSTIIK
jgi:hypothetical protein